MGILLTLEGHRPRVAPSAWVAPTATLIGNVVVRENASVWYNAVLRADGDMICVGQNSNIQDGCILHSDPGVPVLVGEGVSIGHGAVLHGCRVGNSVLVGMSATVLNGANIASGALIGAGSLILENADIPKDSLVTGVPGQVRRKVTAEEQEAINQNARRYLVTRDRYWTPKHDFTF